MTWNRSKHIVLYYKWNLVVFGRISTGFLTIYIYISIYIYICNMTILKYVGRKFCSAWCSGLHMHLLQTLFVYVSSCSNCNETRCHWKCFTLCSCRRVSHRSDIAVIGPRLCDVCRSCSPNRFVTWTTVVGKNHRHVAVFLGLRIARDRAV
jgi:hypothetical protein